MGEQRRGGNGRGESEGDAVGEAAQERGAQTAGGARRAAARRRPAPGLARGRAPLGAPAGGRRSSRAPAISSTAFRSTRWSGTPNVRIPATAPKESCHPGSAQARGFQASVAAAASSSAYQREAGREAAIAAMAARPMTPARCSDGPAPASGT